MHFLIAEGFFKYLLLGFIRKTLTFLNFHSSLSFQTIFPCVMDLKIETYFLVACYVTLHPAMSVCRSVGPLVRPSVRPLVHWSVHPSVCHTLLFLFFCGLYLLLVFFQHVFLYQIGFFFFSLFLFLPFFFLFFSFSLFFILSLSLSLCSYCFIFLSVFLSLKNHSFILFLPNFSVYLFIS